MAYKQTKTRAEREREIKEEEARLSALVETGRTASGKKVEDTLSRPTVKHYDDYVAGHRNLMNGRSNLATRQGVQRDAFYARNYLKNNADLYDKKHGSGAAQNALDYISRTIGDIEKASELEKERAQATTRARNFAEYTRMRKQQEVDDGMKSAAERLLQRYDLSRPGTLPVSGRMLGTPEPENRKPLYTSKAKMTDYLSPQARRFVQNNFPDMYAAGGLPTQSDVEKLIEAGGNPRLGKAFGKLEGNFDKSRTKAANINLEEADKRRQQEREAAQDRRSTYGIRQIGNRAAYATPFSPMPAPEKAEKENRAAEPWKYNIAPTEYAENMGAIDRFNAMGEAPVPDEETQLFLDKYFNGSMPTDEEFESVYDRVMNDYSLSDEEVKYFFDNGADLIGKARENQQQYQSEYDEAKVAYDAAKALLGEGAEEYAGGTEAGYLARYAQGDDVRNIAEQYIADYDVPGVFGTYSEHDATMQSILNRGKENGYSGTDLETARTLLQQEMDDEQAQKYMYLASEYGEDVAQDYYKGLLAEGDYGKRAYEIRDEALREDANDNWAAATGKTFLNVPGQVAGTMYGINQVLKGEKIDPYDIAYMPGQAVQTPRDEVNRMITQNYGKVDEQTGEAKDTFASWLMKAGYNAGTSMVDSRLSGGIAGGSGGIILQDLWAWGGNTQDAILRGGADTQSLLLGGLEAALEAATEYVPMEKFTEALKSENVKTIKDILYYAAAGALSEAPGEAVSELGSAILDHDIMGELSNWEKNVAEVGELGAAKQLVGDVLTSAFVGALSGSTADTLVASGNYAANYKVNKALKAAAIERTEAEQNQPTLSDAASEAAKQPIPSETTQPRDVRAELEQEYMQTAEQQENVPQAAQEPQQQGETVQDEEVEGEQKSPEKVPEKGKNTEAFKQAQMATVETEEGSRAVRVVGVDSVGENGRVMLEVENESGQREVVDGANVMFDNAETEELLAYDAEKLDAKGLRMYLEDYDSSLADAEDYARAFSAVYNRARGGVDYEQAALGNDNARQYLTQDAMIDAFAAGQNVYNQMHNTVQPAAVEAGQQTTAPAQAQLSAKEATKYAKVSRRYTQQAFTNLGDAGRKNAIAQMELLGAIASRTKRTITIVDTIVGKDGQHANAMYNPRTGEIRVALDATEGAYAYAAMHELTHALKNEHKSEWSGFVGFVKGALSDGNQNWDSLVQYQMDQFGYTREQAEEEVVCNTVPALLQDERNVLKLYKGNRTLFDRVVDWVKGLLKDVKTAGTQLSKRSKSWSQMDALANDRKTLQEMYDRLMAVMENEGEDVADTDVVKMSATEVTDPFEEAQKKYAGKNLANDKSLYNYEFLVDLPDMSVTTMESAAELKQEGKPSEKKVIQAALKNGALYGKADEYGVSVQNLYTGRNIRITVKSIRHGLGRGTSGAALANARATAKAGELLRNALPINALFDTGKAASGTYAMAAYVRDAQGKQDHIAVLTIEQRSGDVVGMEVYDTLHALSTRKRNAVDPKVQTASAAEEQGLTSPTRSIEISISDFLEIVNETHQSLLSEDVLAHFNEERNTKGYYADRAKFSMQDSEGNDLSEQQAEYFADSKVRDDEGNLMAVYHGTPSGNFEKFRSETYFTPMEWYADVYQNPSASSISYGKKNDAPMTYKAYLNITKPFDTRNAKERRIFMNEYYQKWGTGAPLSESGLPDWTDGMDLKEFIDEMGYEYDGLILDEGGIPDDNGGVKNRGLSYVIFDPAQAKLTDNKTPTDDERFRYSLRDTDENVQRAMTAEEKAFELIKTHRITAAEADKLAGEMLRNANSTYDRQTLAAEISRTFSYAETGEEVDMAQINDEMTAIAARVMEKSRTLDLEHEEAAKPVRDYLRTTRVRLTAAQRKEAANLVGSYREYSKALFGRVRLNSTAGTTLDGLWSELNSMAPQWFPEDATEGDMAGLLMQAVDATKPVYHTGMGMNMEESANWLAGKLAEQYFALPAVKAAAADAKTFGDSVRALKAAMTRFEEVSWSEFMHAQQELKAARTHEQRTKSQQRVAALHAKYKKWRKQDTAERKERELRNRQLGKIERTTRALLNWMDKPTDAKHIPAGLHDTLARLLASLDFTGKDKKISRELADRLDKLADVMKEYQEGENESRDFFLERDQQLIDEIKRVVELIRGNSSYQGAVEGRGIYGLTGMELKELSKWLDAIRHNIMEASKLRGSNLEGYESVDQAAQMSMAEMSSKKPYKDKKGIVKVWNEHFGPDMQDSFSFFERLGTTAQDVFNGLRSGFDAMVGFTQQAEQHTKTLLEGVKLKELTGKKAKKYTFDLQKGGKVEMTKAQIMELYVLSRREQAQGHMYGGGIRVAGDEDVRPKLLTKADVKKITETLTKDELRIADGMQKFLSRECAAWGNATSTKLVGYAKFGEENYWPIKTDSNERNTTNLDNNYAADINAIKNQGMTKQTKEGASNAIVVGDIFDTYTRHISNMAAYSAYAIPLSDFSRWYNSRGVKTEIEQLMGKKGLEYINNFLMAVNGTGLQDPASGLGKLAGKMSRNAKIAAVGANVRVVIQQPTSYARAAMYMSPKYLSQALTMKKPDAELVNKYCGIAQWKRWGFYETNIGPNLRKMLVGDQSAADKLREKATMLAAMGDNWTLNHLWNACELEVQAETEYKKGSEEYYQQVGKRMSEIIDRTQVVDSVFHRSQMMRSKNAWNQILTNFMGEPTKTFNMLMSAISDYAADRKNKAARNRVARAITTYAVTGVLTAAAAAIVDAIRDEDADKEWAEKYLDALGSNAIDNLNPAGLLPGVKDILSLLQGYEPSRLDQQSIQRIVWAAQEVNKYVNGESKQNLYGVSYKVAQAVSSLLGIPASNLMRDLNAVAQSITGVTPTLTAEARSGQTLSHLFSAMTDGDKKRSEKLRADLREKAGMTPKEIDTAIAKKLAEDQRIKDAWTAKSEKRFADLNRIKNSLTVNGFSSETVDKAINTYGNSVTEKKAKEKNPDEELKVTLYTEAEVVSAVRMLCGVEKGGTITRDDVKAMISERIAGSSAKEPEKSVKSDIQAELKKDYLDAENKGNTAAMTRIGGIMKDLLGTKESTMQDWVKEQHSDNLRSAVDANNSRAALKAVEQMRKDGKTDSTIKSSLTKYKQIYIDAVNRGDRATASKIKSMLMGLGLTGKNGKALYTDETFEDWLK